MLRVRLPALILAAAAGGAAATLGVVDARVPAAVRHEFAPNEVDIGFAQFMPVHHGQAVLLSGLVRDRASTPVRRIADAIGATQLTEIGRMRGWLALWQQPQVPTTRRMTWLEVSPGPIDAELASFLAQCRAGGSSMPGQPTIEELERVRVASGPELDRLYLSLMIRHHSAAVPMARFAQRFAHTDAVRALATAMALEQRQELQQLIELDAMASRAPLQDLPAPAR